MQVVGCHLQKACQCRCCRGRQHRLNAACAFTGNWAGLVPQCQCDEGYQVATRDGRGICQGLVKLFPSLLLQVCFNLQQHNLQQVFHVLLLSILIPLPPLPPLSVLHLLSVQHVLKLYTLSVQTLQMVLIIKPILNTLTNVLQLNALSVLHVLAVNPVMILLHFYLMMIQPVLTALHVLMIQLVLTVQPVPYLLPLTPSMVSPLMKSMCCLVLFFQCIDHVTCESKSEGLVRYPTTLAPTNGSVTVTAQCADNAHITNSTSLIVACASEGIWSSETPHCQCDKGYTLVIVSEENHKCEGKGVMSFVFCSAVASAHSQQV